MVSTGVPELDSLLGKGFPDRSAILVKGAVGSGKESLAYRFEMAGLARGDYCLFITHRAVRDILDDAKGSGIDLEPSALVWVASQGSPTKYDPDDLATLSYNLKELLKDSSNNHIIVVVDALSPLLMVYQPETIYKFLRQLLEDAKKHDSVILATFDKGMHKPERGEGEGDNEGAKVKPVASMGKRYTLCCDLCRAG